MTRFCKCKVVVLRGCGISAAVVVMEGLGFSLSDLHVIPRTVHLG